MLSELFRVFMCKKKSHLAAPVSIMSAAVGSFMVGACCKQLPLEPLSEQNELLSLAVDSAKTVTIYKADSKQVTL